ncbi:hypothetical protein J7L13_01880 [bacterium]|nr:hypothetical protein [bacterium]
MKRRKAAKLKEAVLEEVKEHAQVLKTATLGVIYNCNSALEIKRWLDRIGIKSVRVWKRGDKYAYFEVRTSQGLLYFPLKELGFELVDAFACIHAILRTYNFCRDIGAYGVDLAKKKP